MIFNIYYSKYIDINYIGANLSKNVRKKKKKLLQKRKEKEKEKKNYMDFYLVAHQTHACRLLAAQRRRSIFPGAALLGLGRSVPQCSFPTRAQARSQASDLPRVGGFPLGGVQRRRASPRLGGGSPSRLSPLASRLAPSPPSSAHRPATLRTHLPLPSRLCCTVGARPAAQGGRALAPLVAV